MSVIRNLVLREWFKYLLGAAFILLMLVSVANLISGLLRENVTALEVLLNYVIELPGTIMQILPVSCMVASLFSVNKLKNRNELTAIFAAGFSRRSFIITVIEGAIVIALLQFALSAYIQPSVKLWRTKIMSESIKKFKNLQSQGLKASTIGSGKIWYKTDKYFFSFAAYDKQTNTLSDVSVFHYGDSHKLERKVEAKKVEYISGNQWNFLNGREFSKLNGDQFPKVEVFEKKQDIINESLSDFKQIEADITILDIRELYNYIEKLSNAGINTNSYEVMFYNQLSSPLVCVIFAILAATLIFNPNRRSSSFGKSLIFVFVFVIVYWLINSYVLALGQSSRLNAPLACFLVPSIFTLYLFYYFYKHRHLR